jgi:osmoprotectant transport system permease protein
VKSGRSRRSAHGALRGPLLSILALLLLLVPAARGWARVAIGSKAFPESWILGEALAIEMREMGTGEVVHRHNLGGTEIVFQALQSGAVDVYPEYTGTIQEVLIQSKEQLPLAEIRVRLERLGLMASDPIGFNDSYALATTAGVAERYGLRTISDLARHPELRLGLTHEFLGRADGYPGLARRYHLAPRKLLGIQHELAYGALASGSIDVTDIYTTDAQIERMGLRVLEDDLGFFPRYDAVWLYRADLAERDPAALRAIQRLTGRIDETAMIRANARVVLQRIGFAESADTLLKETLGRTRAPGAAPPKGGAGSAASSIARNTLQHIKLVLLSLIVAIVIGVPLGVLAARSAAFGGAILSLAGLLQTIPSLALLAVLIPLLGIGVLPALVALFLYSLLPIVRNTYVGLTTLPSHLRDAAASIGLSPRAQLLRIRLPMASPAIMAGIKTSAVINVGSATLAALIGAGGLGEPILSGIQLRHNGLILQGAIPAAVLALVVQRAFDLLDRIAVPRGLRLPEERPDEDAR